MIAPPPSTLHVEGAAHETRIELVHGRPRSPMVPWKRVILVLWLISVVATVFVPLIFCPVGLMLSLVFFAVVMMEVNRREVARLAMRSDHMQIVRHGLFGRTTQDVRWDAVEQVQLASELGRRRDAVILRWTGDDEKPQEVEIGTGRPADELRWMHAAFELITTRARG